MLTDKRIEAGVIYLQLRGRLDDLPDDLVRFIRSNLSTDDRLHLWAFLLGDVGV